jgi:hypothetical protein
MLLHVEACLPAFRTHPILALLEHTFLSTALTALTLQRFYSPARHTPDKRLHATAYLSSPYFNTNHHELLEVNECPTKTTH